MGHVSHGPGKCLFCPSMHLQAPSVAPLGTWHWQLVLPPMYVFLAGYPTGSGLQQLLALLWELSLMPVTLAWGAYLPLLWEVAGPMLGLAFPPGFHSSSSSCSQAPLKCLAAQQDLLKELCFCLSQAQSLPEELLLLESHIQLLSAFSGTMPG